MKSLNLVTTLAVAVTLIATGAGCKKTPKNTTFIPPITRMPPSDAGTTPNLAPPINRTAQNNTGPVTGGVTPPGNQLTGDTTPKGTDLSQVDNGTTSKPLVDINSDAAKTQQRFDPDQFSEDNTTLQAETVLFAYDSAAVRGSEVAKVQRVAAYLKNEGMAKLRVEGNCDERGTEEYNRSLGERRALAVRELLIAEGVAPDRITTLSYGEDKPVDPGHDETAWARNRRSDFVVLKPKMIQ